MKLSIVTVLVAATFSLMGCSSSPLEPAPESEGNPGATAGAGRGGASGGRGSGGNAGVEPASATPSWTAYPAGPYGTSKGATIQNLSFLGWKHPEQAGYDPAKVETVRLSDFYDPDGQTGVKLLAVNASAVWCGVCRREYQDMHTNDVYANLRPQGLEILGTLFEDTNSFPAQPQDLRNWAAIPAHSVKFPFVLDPGFKLGAYFDSDATPLNMLIDVRTMTIVQVTMGISDPTSKYWTQVQALLEKM